MSRSRQAQRRARRTRRTKINYTGPGWAYYQRRSIYVAAFKCPECSRVGLIWHFRKVVVRELPHFSHDCKCGTSVGYREVVAWFSRRPAPHDPPPDTPEWAYFMFQQLARLHPGVLPENWKSTLMWGSSRVQVVE